MKICSYEKADKFAVNKITCALLSGIPVEVEWAYNVLAAASYSDTDRLSLVEWPNLLKALKQHISDYLNSTTSELSSDGETDEEEFGI